MWKDYHRAQVVEQPQGRALKRSFWSSIVQIARSLFLALFALIANLIGRWLRGRWLFKAGSIVVILLLAFGLFKAPSVISSVADKIGLGALLDRANIDPGVPEAFADLDEPPVLLGLYTSASLQVTNWEIENFDQWLLENGINKRVTLAGTYLDIEYLNPDWNVHQELNAAWDLGYTPFLNLTAYQQKAYQIADDPAVEERIRWFASAFARWSEGGEKRAFIAPLQEMNGGWVRYGRDPDGFKRSWLKIQRIFREEGVSDEAVVWVFAPNAWSDEGHEFERYYPGDPYVDAVAFSTMNFGLCPEYIGNWDTFELIYEPYLERMRLMAPGKPIFLSQTATVNVGPDGPDDDLKNDWLRDTYTKLAAYPGVRGILYFNIVKPEPSVEKCRPLDWRIYDQHAGIAYQGFLDAVRSPRYEYWAPDSMEMDEIVFGERAQATFADVWPATPFSGQEDPWYLPWVETLVEAGLAPGCRSETFDVMGEQVVLEYYCPEEDMTWADVAHFIEIAIREPWYQPPEPQGIFEDVPQDHWAAGWIEAFVADGFTAGCDVGKYCPDAPVTRAQMAVILDRALVWPEPYMPTTPDEAPFVDVPAEHWAAGSIQKMADERISAGCGWDRFCPDTIVSRADVAALIVRAFDLGSGDQEEWIKGE